MPAARPVEIVLHVVGAVPDQIDRRAGDFRNPCRLHHVVVHQPPAEAAADAREVDGDVVRRDTERARDQPAARLRVLRRRPDLDLVALGMRGAVLRLQRGMRNERVMVGRLHHMRGTAQRACGVAVIAQAVRRRLGAERHGLAGKAFAALRARCAFVPLYLQVAARFFRTPPAVGNDRHAGHQPGEVAAAFHYEGMAHARHFAQRIEIGARHLAAEHRAFLEYGMQHARHHGIDAEQRLALHHLGAVVARLGMTDDLVVLRILQLETVEIGQRLPGGRGGERAVGERAAAGGVAHMAVGGGAFAHRHFPTLRRGGDQHGARGRARPCAAGSIRAASPCCRRRPGGRKWRRRRLPARCAPGSSRRPFRRQLPWAGWS